MDACNSVAVDYKHEDDRERDFLTAIRGSTQNIRGSTQNLGARQDGSRSVVSRQSNQSISGIRQSNPSLSGQDSDNILGEEQDGSRNSSYQLP